jgi:hypothetical protein
MQLGKFVVRNFEVVDKCDRSRRIKITPPWLASLKSVGICSQRSSGPKAACQRSEEIRFLAKKFAESLRVPANFSAAFVRIHEGNNLADTYRFGQDYFLLGCSETS